MLMKAGREIFVLQSFILSGRGMFCIITYKIPMTFSLISFTVFIINIWVVFISHTEHKFAKSRSVWFNIVFPRPSTVPRSK